MRISILETIMDKEQLKRLEDQVFKYADSSSGQCNIAAAIVLFGEVLKEAANTLAKADRIADR